MDTISEFVEYRRLAQFCVIQLTDYLFLFWPLLTIHHLCITYITDNKL